MTWTPVIHQWPLSVAPIDQLFMAGGVSVSGGMTLGGVATENPEPGGRAMLSFSFATMVTVEANVAASWLASQSKNGAVFSVPIYDCAQLVPASVIFGAAADNFTEVYNQYSEIPERRWEPFLPVTAAALAGSETVVANVAELGRVLLAGHVIGFRSGAYDFAHVVTDITYDAGNVATIKVSPPLRRDLAIADKLHLRPRMIGAISGDIGQMFKRGRHMAPAAVSVVEVLV